LAKSLLGSSYEIKNLEEAKLIHGMCIDKNLLGDVILLQCAYCEYLLKQFNMDMYLPMITLLPPSLILSVEDCPSTPDEVNKIRNIPFHEALGLLIWL